MQHSLLLTCIYYCNGWRSSYLLSNNVYPNSVSHCIHVTMSLSFGNVRIQNSKGENLCARPQGLLKCDKSTYWSRFHWSLAWLGVCISHFGNLGHSNFTPNPSKHMLVHHKAGYFRGFRLAWKKTLVLIAWEGSRQQVRRTELVCTNSNVCRHQHLNECLDYPNRGGKKK